MALILASTSPRRRELLALLGIPFDVKSPSFEERLMADCRAIEQVQSFARGKAFEEALYRQLAAELNALHTRASEEELADVMELLIAIAKQKGISWNGMEEARRRKRAEFGGYENGVVLQ